MTIEEYLDAKRNGLPYAGKMGTEKTLATYGEALRRAEALVGKPLSKWVVKDGERMVRESKSVGHSPATRNQTVTAVRSFFAWAIGNKLYDGPNPMANIMAETLPRKLPTILTREEIDRLLNGIETALRRKREEALSRDDNTKHFGWAQEDTAEKYGLLFRIMFQAGLRIEEILTLRKDGVLDDGVKVIGKGRKERFVPLSAHLIDRLKRYVADHPYTDYVFYGEAGRSFGIDMGKPMTPHSAYQAFKAGLEEARLPSDLTPHVLRHSFATMALNKTKRLEVVQDLLGHSSPNTTRIYAQVAKDELKEEYAKLGF
jgi:site-specific recombinase XerD